jgi:hypothetical protein
VTEKFDPRENPAEMVAGEDADLEELRSSTDAFLHSSIEAKPRADDAEYRARCHRALDHILSWDRRRRAHAALDRVLAELDRRTCSGDRAFLKKAGIRP